MATVSRLFPCGDQDDTVTGSFRAGEGTPLVLLHGANMSWRAWRPVLPFLTARHDVFVPTMAGHRGGPVMDPDVQGMSAVVDMLCDQLDEAGIETAHVAGNSLGGWVAVELARRGRARSVTALSPAGAWRSDHDLARLLLMFRAAGAAIGVGPLRALAGHPLLRQLWLRGAVERPGRLSDEDVAGMIEDAMACVALAGAFSGKVRMHRMAPFDVAHCPVRVAWSQHDRTIPYRRYGHPMRETIPGAEFLMLPGVGHVPMSDDPRLVARTILELTTAVDETLVDELPTPRRRSARRAPRRAGGAALTA
jgi:pimeloyl-ACP methyl ester carboxylesterase